MGQSAIDLLNERFAGKSVRIGKMKDYVAEVVKDRFKAGPRMFGTICRYAFADAHTEIEG